MGRLLARRPPSASSPAPRDSMLYDVAGNVVQTITRRGDTFTATYDSRNRLLTQVVPGVGTINRSYTGPLDQLTRTWVTGAVDSIGGVNGEVKTVFDARGRVVSDTVFRDTTAIGTRYAVDIYERDSSVTDPLGSWFTRYDATRGAPERLITPFSDSLALSLDGQYRPSARTVKSSGPDFVQSVQFLATSGAARLTHQAGATGYEAGTYDPEGQVDEPINGAALGPLWVEQHGSGAAPDSLVDSLSYDGWGRMLGWRHHRKVDTTLTLLATDSVWFDRTGNVYALGETRTYELQTDRLLTRSAVGNWSWTYSYDAAGNLTQASGTKGILSTTWTYGYDGLNQLRSVRKDGNLVARYGYDVLGRRIARRVYSVSLPGADVRETRYLYQGGHVGAETDPAGNIKWKYTWGPGTDNLIGLQDSTGTQYYVVQDQLGSVRGLVKRDGTWIMHQRFTPYGTLLARDSAGSSMPKGFHVGWTGREHDAETGFTFHRARYYSPDLRRWTQEDPIGYAGGGNLYAYVGGAVMEARDPSGLVRDCSEGACGNPHDWSGAWGFDSYGNYTGGGGTRGERASRRAQLAALALLRRIEAQGRITIITVRIGGRIEEITFRGTRPLTSTCDVCKELGNRTLYAGVQVDVYDGVGGTAAAGVFVDSKGAGSFWRVGPGIGVDVSAGAIAGVSESFSGFSVGGQAGVGAWSFGVASSSAGLAGGGDWTYEAGIGAGLPVSINAS